MLPWEEEEAEAAARATNGVEVDWLLRHMLVDEEEEEWDDGASDDEVWDEAEEQELVEVWEVLLMDWECK